MLSKFAVALLAPFAIAVKMESAIKSQVSSAAGDDMSGGLSVKYYEGNWSMMPDFDSLTPFKTDMVWNIDMEGGDVFTSGKGDHVGAVFEGFFYALYAGLYVFATNSDDGSKLWIDGSLVVDNDGLHHPIEVEAHVELTAGYHPVRVEYFDGDGGNVMQVKAQGPGLPMGVVPATYWTHEDSPCKDGVSVEVYDEKAALIQYMYPIIDNKEPVATYVDADINWHGDFHGRADGEFLLRFLGYIDIPEDGFWKFGLNSNDGSRLLVNDYSFIWNDGMRDDPRNMTGNKTLKKGLNKLQVDFYNIGPNPSLELSIGEYYRTDEWPEMIVPASWFKHGECPLAE